MKPRLYLHAGMHKTGTSAIQKWAKANREVLENNGLHYPDYSPFAEMKINGHMQFTHSLAGKPSQLTLEECERLVEIWKKKCLEKGCDLFFSAESIFRHLLKSQTMHPRMAYLVKIKEIFSEFDVIPVLVFRRPDSFIESLYKENVSKPADPLPKISEWAKTKFHLKYTENYLRYQEVFGTTIVMIYENLIKTPNFVQSFFEGMGYQILAKFEAEAVRKSLSVPQIILKNYSNRYIHDRTVNKQFVDWLAKNKAQIHHAFGNNYASLWESAQEQRSFMRDFPLEEFYQAVGLTASEEMFPPQRVIDNVKYISSPPEHLKIMVDQLFLDETKPFQEKLEQPIDVL